MDILGPFTSVLGQLKYLIIIMDYFTKWIETKALANITTTKILKFLKSNVLSRFGVPQAIVANNRTQFIDKRFKILLEELKVKKTSHQWSICK